jgi:superoxide dismutase, Cu-Zn family
MHMKKAVFTLALLLSASAPAVAADMTAAIDDNKQNSIGTTEVTKTHKGAIVRVELHNVAEGWHGVHFHGKGDCSDHDAYKHSGSHAALEGQTHGFMSSKGPHTGDLPNIWVGKDGMGKAEFFMAGIDPNQLLDKDGSAFIVHKGIDDYMSEPAGNAGDRLGCGVLAGVKRD